MQQMERQDSLDTVPLPEGMQRKLLAYRKTVWVIKITEGVLAGMFGLFVSYLLVFGLDRLFDAPAVLRTAILVAGSVGMLILFPLKYHDWVWSHRRLDQVARLVRRRFPRFGDQLLGIIELAQRDADAGVSRRLVEAAMQQVDAELKDRDLSGAVPEPKARRWAVAAGIPLLLIVVVFVVIPAAGGNALWRWAMPWLDVERYTFAQLDGESGRMVVPYAEPFDVEVALKGDSPWKPESAEARYVSLEAGDQAPIVAGRDGSKYEFAIPPQTKDGTVTITVGDASREIPVEPKLRPALKTITAEVQLPAYLQRSEPLSEDVRGGTVTIVKGSTAVFHATATRELALCTMDARAQQAQGALVTTERVEVAASSKHELTWRDRFGLTPREPQVLSIEAVEDGAPTVAFDKLQNNQVVLADQTIAFDIFSADDFGVSRLGLEWEGIEDPVHNPKPDKGEKLVAAGGPAEDEMTVKATFSATRENVRPQSLRMRAFAEDYLPGRKRSYSTWIVIHVLTKEQHLKWVTEQISKWAEVALEVQDKELELHETNKELSEMTPSELAEPVNQAKLQEQAAAENANAAKLDALVDIGKQLVKEAAKNEKFDASQLEAFAELLKKLEELANENMPKIADLLAQAAAAPGPPAGEPIEDPKVAFDPAEGKAGKPDEKEPEPGVEAPPGGVDRGLEKPDKYGPDAKDLQGLDKDPKDPNTPGGDVVQDKSKQPDGKPGYLPANPTPLVLDFESTFNKPEKAEDAPQLVGGLLPPSTVLEGSGKEEKPKPAAETKKQIVLKAVHEQKELLDAFQKLAEEMNKLLMSFENSTFVKRLKAASRRQIDIAVAIDGLPGFGVSDAPENPKSEKVASLELAQAEKVFTILEDMAAFAGRKPSVNYTQVLTEMHDATVVDELRDVAGAIVKNRVGESVIDAEFWADNLDRWAEQLVDPLGDGTPPPVDYIELPSLTPEMVLAVMRLIDGETQLRDETRELEKSKPALASEEYARGAAALAEKQATMSKQSRELAEQIAAMPKAPGQADATFGKVMDDVEAKAGAADDVRAKAIAKLVAAASVADGEAKATIQKQIATLEAEGEVQETALALRIEEIEFAKKLAIKILGGEIKKLNHAAKVMDEVAWLLIKPPRTDMTVIAAETEVIEILLKTHRLPNAPMVVMAPPASALANALAGIGDDSSRSSIENRAPDQATGKAGRKLPAEFRQGLDAYFNALEGRK